MKLMGLLLLVAACGGIGLIQARKLRERVVFLEDFRRFLTAAESAIVYGRMPVGELVCSFRREMPLLEDCARLLEQGMPFPRAWREVSRQAGPDRELVQGFGLGLGATGLDGQLSHLRLYQELTQNRLAEARSGCEKKGKLYRQLGFLGGAALALTLW